MTSPTRFGGLREARRRDQPDANAVERLLDDLALAHREPVEHGAQPEDAPAVARNQEIAAPPVDAGDHGQRTAAGARLGRGPEAPAVTDAIADQRHIGVDEAGANELPINGLGDPDLGPEMELAGLAFTSRRDVLVHTVGLAHGAVKRFRDDRPLMVGQRLGIGDHDVHPQIVAPRP